MTRRTTQTFHGYDRPDVTVTLPDGHEHAGEHFGTLRAWAVDDDTGDWFGQAEYSVAPGNQLLGWIPADQLRPYGELTDDDGLVNRPRS